MGNFVGSRRLHGGRSRSLPDAVSYIRIQDDILHRQHSTFFIFSFILLYAIMK